MSLSCRRTGTLRRRDCRVSRGRCSSRSTAATSGERAYRVGTRLAFSSTPPLRVVHCEGVTSSRFRGNSVKLAHFSHSSSRGWAGCLISCSLRLDGEPRGRQLGARGGSSTRTAPTNTALGRVEAAATMSAHPSLVEWKKLRFVIMDAPKANNLHLYIRELKKQNVVCVVRVCEPTYPASEVEAAGIKLLEMEYDDGGAPPVEIINKWLDVVQTTFHNAPDSSGPNGSEGPTIAVHCVAGLGRAPVLVAIALIEYGKDPIKAVEYIRDRRRGAINRKQLSYLDSYERRSSGNGCSSCVVM